MNQKQKYLILFAILLKVKKDPISFQYALVNGRFEADIKNSDKDIWIGCGIFEDDGLLVKDMCGGWESQHFSLYDQPCTREEFFQEFESMFN